MRKWVWGFLGLITVAAIGFFAFAPGILESRTNKVDGLPLIPVSPEAKALHASLRIARTVNDTCDA